jgi:hypothetical protein
MSTATAEALRAATEAALHQAADKVAEAHPEVVMDYGTPEPTPRKEFVRPAGLTLSEVLTSKGIAFTKPEGSFDPPCEVRGWHEWDEFDSTFVPSLAEFEHYEVDWAALSTLAWTYHMGWRIKFDGPPGTGKTEITKFFAALLGVPYWRQNFYEGMDIDYVIGSATLEDGEKGTITGYLEGKLAYALRRGGIVLMDEPWKAPPTIWSAFANLLEEGGFLQLLGHPGDDRLFPAEGTCIIFADNAKGCGDQMDKYASAQIQDRSIINRIQVHHELHYMPASQEESLLERKVPGTNEIRVAYDKGEISNACSLRQLVPLMRTGQYFTLADAWGMHYRKSLTDEDKGLFDQLYFKVYGETFPV